MPNILHAKVKEDNSLDYDDFTSTMAEVDKNTCMHYCDIRMLINKSCTDYWIGDWKQQII